MSQRVYNFGAGPAMLPTEVMEEVQQEMLDYQGHGASIIEISHRAPPFLEILEETESIFRRLTGLGSSHVMFFMHGGAQMQFSAVPLNLMASKEKRSAVYLITGKWGVLAEEEARKFGSTRIALDGKPLGFRKIPEWEEILDPETSYVHLTSNNTLYGTQWQEYPDTGEVPLVSDSTSDILSRKEDYSRSMPVCKKILVRQDWHWSWCGRTYWDWHCLKLPNCWITSLPMNNVRWPTPPVFFLSTSL